jgi:hypothetical protein
MAVDSVKAILNGTEYTLTLNPGNGKYEANIIAPATTSWLQEDHKYGITVIAEDTAGNKTTKDRTDATLGANLMIRVLEKTKPTVNILSPSSGARVITSKPTIKFTLLDAHSGIDLSTLSFKIDGTDYVAGGLTTTAITNGYECTYIPPTALTENSHTITISVADNDGNASTVASSNFVVDTVPPALNITTPSNNLITNTAALTIQGTTNDTVSTPVVVTVKLNCIDQGEVNVVGGAFSKEITLSEGSNTIVITATDAAGLESSVTRTVTLDTVAPIIKSVSLSANPVDAGSTFVITVEVED